jgi:hypothetical protein
VASELWGLAGEGEGRVRAPGRCRRLLGALTLWRLVGRVQAGRWRARSTGCGVGSSRPMSLAGGSCGVLSMVTLWHSDARELLCPANAWFISSWRLAA